MTLYPVLEGPSRVRVLKCGNCASIRGCKKAMRSSLLGTNKNKSHASLRSATVHSATSRSSFLIFTIMTGYEPLDFPTSKGVQPQSSDDKEGLRFTSKLPLPIVFNRCTVAGKTSVHVSASRPHFARLISVRHCRCDGAACCSAVLGNHSVPIIPQLDYSIHAVQIRLARRVHGKCCGKNSQRNNLVPIGSNRLNTND